MIALDLVCRVCGQEVPVKVSGRAVNHPSTETSGLCGGSDLLAVDPIL